MGLSPWLDMITSTVVVYAMMGKLYKGHKWTDVLTKLKMGTELWTREANLAVLAQIL